MKMLNPVKLPAALSVAICLGALSASADYFEDFTSYEVNTTLSNGDTLASGNLTWKQSSFGGDAVIVAADDNLTFTLPGGGNNVYGFMQESSAMVVPSGSDSVNRTVDLSMQEIASGVSGADAFGVGFYGVGTLPAASGWGSTIGMTVQFADFSGTNALVIRRRGSDGTIDSWNGSEWTNDFTVQLSSISLNTTYTVEAIVTDSILTLSVMDGETIVESATSDLSGIFSYGSGMQWTVGDYNSQNSNEPYEFTINGLSMTSIPEPQSGSVLLIVAGLLMVLKARCCRQ